MSEPRQGGCLCGAVRYEVTAPPAFAAHCHCRTCQRASGGPMKTNAAYPASAFRILTGEPAIFSYRGDSGHHVESSFCGACGAQLFGRAQLAPDTVFVSASSLDESDSVKPSAHAYFAAARCWDPTGDDLPKFDRLPG